MPDAHSRSQRPQSELLRTLADKISAMLAYWDGSLRCRYANRAYEMWFGVSPESLLGKHISELLGPLYKLNLPYIEGALRGERQEFEREIPDPSGGPLRYSLAHYIPDVVDGVVHGFFVMVSDISRIKRAELALKESEARFSGIVSLSPDAIFSVDDEQRIVLFNESAQAIFGWTPEEVLGKPLSILIPERFRTVYRRYVSRFARSGIKARRLGEERPALFGLRKNGDEFPAEAALSKLGLSGKTLLTVSLRDISERKRVAQEREQILARERQAREHAEAVNEKLRESEERFRLTLDEAPIGMALAAPDGRFTRVNRALCEIVGYTEEELTGLSFQVITHPEDLDADLALVGRLARGEISRYQLEKRYLRKNGSIVDILLSASVLRERDGSPRYYIAQIEDITERKQFEKRLLLAEAKSSGILSISADAIISVDGHQRITMFNEGAEKIFGYHREEVLGAALDVLLPEQFRSAHHRHVATFAMGEQTARRMGERSKLLLGLRKNGEQFPADAAISKLEVGGTKVLTVSLRDITEQKRIENEQRFLAEVGRVLGASLDYEQTLTRISELAVQEFADLCILKIVANGEEAPRFKVASRDPGLAGLCEQLTQVPLERSNSSLLRSVLTAGRAVLIPRPSAQMISTLAQDEPHQQVLQAAGISSVVAVPLVAYDRILGAILLLSTTAARLYGPADVRLLEDLALRAALSLENARLYRAARRATEARDEVLGIVAHDLRNPLNSILLLASLLHRAESDRRSRERAEGIERAASRMNRLIQDLLDVTRIEAGCLSIEQAEVSVPQLLYDLMEAQKLLATSASFELRLDVAPDLPKVWADRDRLLQVFENLIGNAFKFTPPGGRITVGAAPRGDDVLFWVSDTGSGIAKEELPHLFDRFWQARKAERRGVGLGLSIVKGIIQAHGGHIWVESTPGQGSTFLFRIPAVLSTGLAPL